MNEKDLLEKIERMELRLAELESRQLPEGEVPALRVLRLKDIARALASGDKGPLKAWNTEQKRITARELAVA